MMRYAALLLLALAGCEKDKKDFPSAIADSSYFNGHALARNAVDDPEARFEAELLALTNAKRAELGLSALSRNQALDALARAHSLHMSEHVFFDHNNPEGDHAANRLSYFASGVPWVIHENIWIVEPGKDPQYVLDGFLGSPSHYASIVSPSHLIGLGVVTKPYNSVPGHIYVTMEFLELR
jgi:uncharacterized protein YkwD